MRQKQSHPQKIKPPKKAYSFNALTNAYKQCIENNMSTRKAAKIFNIPRSTLRDRLSGRVHIDTVSTKMPLFTVLEETRLVDHIKKMASYGYGYTRQECVNLASNMAIQLGKRKKEEPLKLKWIRGFLERWPELRVLKPRGLEYTRAKMASEAAVSSYFENLKQCINENSLNDKQHLIFNLDVKGVTTEHKPPYIVGSSSLCPPAVTCGRGKTITILGCISVSGMAVPPFFVFPGKRMNATLLEGKSPGADGTMSETGWSNHEVFRQYLQDHFVKYIPGRDNQKILLILDGHKSHVSVDLFQWAKENGIIFFFLPPHTSHILQPLDVACYGPFERINNAECHKLMRHTEYIITRYNVCEIACRVYSKALSTDNAQSAFRRTGIHPLDKTAISPEVLIPAEIYKDNHADSDDSEATVEGGVEVENLRIDNDNEADYDNILDMFSAKETQLKKVKSEKVKTPRRTMSKLVSGREVNDEVLRQMKEHKIRNKPVQTKKTPAVVHKKPSKKQTKKPVCNSNTDPKPGPSCINLSLLSDSECSSVEGESTETVCCVCHKFQPEELAQCVSLIFTKWAQCDGMKNGFPCLHWVHLKYCTPVKVIRRGDTFMCPHCQNEE